ncbi:MAG: phytanoyl-CoA dioxygenase family protein [Pseudomonadota bacterium]
MALISDEDVAAFRRDGAVALRSVFRGEWTDMLASAMEASLAAPGPNYVNHAKTPGAPAYHEDFWSWETRPEFRDFVQMSPCAPLAAELLGASRVNLVMDNWFVREAGATSRPPFHQDLSYFDFAGTMCVLWLPLEAVTAENGVAFVKGSHLWGKHFMRVRFADGHKADESGEVTVNGVTYEPPPDVAADPGAYELLSWDLNLGDCVFFDMRTLHGGLATQPQTQTSRRYTLRMTAEDGMIRYRGDWAAEERAMFEARGYRDGDPIGGEMFPQLWPRP